MWQPNSSVMLQHNTLGNVHFKLDFIFLLWPNPSTYKTPDNVQKGRVHSSRIKCKGVQVNQKTGTSSPISSKMFRSIHPENKNVGCSLTFFSTFLYSGGCSHTFFRKWVSFYQLICVTLHPYI